MKLYVIIISRKTFSADHAFYIYIYIFNKLQAHETFCLGRKEPPHKGVNQRSRNVTQTHHQRPESPTVPLTWHASKCNVHELHQSWEGELFLK